LSSPQGDSAGGLRSTPAIRLSPYTAAELARRAAHAGPARGTEHAQSRGIDVADSSGASTERTDTSAASWKTSSTPATVSAIMLVADVA
jgi:hypothetical protein